MQQIADWLQKLGLGQYGQRFAENDISFVILPDLTDQDLEKIGVASLGHRRQLLRAIAELKGAPELGTAAAAVAPHDTAERRQVTVMFSDLVGSTALSARMDPEDLREVISGYQKCVAEIVQRLGGFVAKYMGDGVLVYLGYPQAHEDDAERAVRAGLELVAAVGALKTHAPLQTRVGIATGLVVVGDLIGSGASQEQAIVGETPNLAARLQGVAEPNSVVIAESTRKLVGNLFELEDLGAQDLKGIAGPVRAWTALRPSSAESRFEALHAGGLTELVGREEELELLLRRWSKAKTGEGQVVLLSGEPGIGKSRLTAALLERLATEPHIRLRYFCSPQHTDSVLYPIISQMDRAAGFALGDTAQTKLDKLDALLAQTSTRPHDVALCAEMLSLLNDGRYPTLELARQQRRQKTLEALVAQIEALSRSNPVLIIFEDVHWIDPTSLDALGPTIDRLKTLTALLIVTYRPEFEAPWIGRPHVTALTLNRLGEREIEAMIDRVIGDWPLPASIRQEIIEHTDGIPLFVEEMTKAVIEGQSDGLAERRAAAAISFPALAVPASLHASLMARLDRLGPVAKSIAQIGAAIGQEFSYDLLRAVAQRAVDDGVAALTAAQLVFQRGMPPDASFLFKHALVQDAAYSTLLRGRRQQLHAAVAQVLEEQFPERATNQPEVVAHHWTEASRPERAVGYWLKAGRRSAERSADREAVRQLHRGLEALMSLPVSADRDRMELDFQLALGTPLISIYGWSGSPVAAAYERASELCDQLGETERAGPTLFGLASNRIVRGQTSAAQQLAKQLHSLADRYGDPITRLLGHRAMGAALMQLGRLWQARSEFEKIMAVYDPQRDRSLAARCITDPRASGLSFLSLVLWVMGYPDQAASTAQEAFRCAAELGHANTMGHIRFYAGAGLAELNVAAARDHADAAIALADEHHLPPWRSQGIVFRGWALAQTGGIEQGISLVQQGIAEMDAAGTIFHRSRHLGILAVLHAQLGDWAAGLRVLEGALADVKRTGACFWEAELRRIEGELRHLSGASDAEVEASFAEALVLARQQDAKSFELRAAMSLARLWRDQGKVQQARELLAPVYGWFSEGFDTRDLKEAKALLAELAS